MDLTKTQVRKSPRTLGTDAGPIELPSGVNAALFFLSGPRRGETVPINGACAIGRGEDAGLILDDPEISALHAMIELDGGGDLRVRDLESLNGTFLNGERLEDRGMLMDGDVLGCGGTLFKVLVRPKPPEPGLPAP